MRNVQNALRMPLLGVTYKILNRPAKALCFRRVRRFANNRSFADNNMNIEFSLNK
jgi:hypothetical protein